MFQWRREMPMHERFIAHRCMRLRCASQYWMPTLLYFTIFCIFLCLVPKVSDIHSYTHTHTQKHTSDNVSIIYRINNQSFQFIKYTRMYVSTSMSTHLYPHMALILIFSMDYCLHLFVCMVTTYLHNFFIYFQSWLQNYQG